MSSVDPHPLRNYHAELTKLKALLSRATAKQVSAKSIIEQSRNVVNIYFNNIRPFLVSSNLANESMAGLDLQLQELLSLAQKKSQKKLYDRILKLIIQELNGVEISLITAGQLSDEPRQTRIDGKEQRIVSTLAKLVPTAGMSYEQACLDLRGEERTSYRGSATELREALRETLDHLAPDKDVMSQQGFKLEDKQTKPTMKQKVRYILTSRGISKSLTETPESAVAVIEESVGSLARSVYTRASISTHSATSKREVQKIKTYVDVLLGELLEIT